MQAYWSDGDRAPRPAQAVRGQHDPGEAAEVLHDLPCLFDLPHRAAPRDRLPDLPHQVRERLAVLASNDRLEAGPEELHIILLEDPGLREFGAQVQPRLPAHSAEDAVRSFLRDDLLQEF